MMGMAFTGYPPPIRWKLRRWPKFRRWFLEDDETLVRVGPLKLHYGPYGLEGPSLLVDRPGGRMAVWPIWDRARLLAPFRDLQEGDT